MDSAIRQSLAILEDEFQNGDGLDLHEHSLSDLYTSLCVLINQQFAPVPVLALMWRISEDNAEDICVMLSSMSLAKMPTQMLDGREQCGVNIHDLHLDFCRHNAGRSGVEKLWHRRLLNGHMTTDTSLNAGISMDEVDNIRGFNMLEYLPRQ